MRDDKVFGLQSPVQNTFLLAPGSLIWPDHHSLDTPLLLMRIRTRAASLFLFNSCGSCFLFIPCFLKSKSQFLWYRKQTQLSTDIYWKPKIYFKASEPGSRSSWEAPTTAYRLQPLVWWAATGFRAEVLFICLKKLNYHWNALFPHVPWIAYG